jgi:hypothetical protein
MTTRPDFVIRHDLTTDSGMRRFLEIVHEEKAAGRRVTVEFVQPEASQKQKNALHLWCNMVADTLNAAGLDMRKAVREEIDIPWTKESVKTYLWKPLQQYMTGYESTKRPSRTQYPEISDTLVRHFACKFGVQLPPWPTVESKREAEK